MFNQRLITISEFSRLAMISRKNLIFYDEAGLFPPAAVGKNGYRYYTLQQLLTAGVIGALRAIGVPLGEIRTYLDNRTPEKLLALCDKETDRIAAEIDKLGKILEMMRNIRATTEGAQKVKTGGIEIAERGAERLFMGPDIAKPDEYSINDALAEFYRQCAGRGLMHSYPYGTVTRRADLLKGRGRSFPPARFFCAADNSLPDEFAAFKPAGRYVVGYGRGDYGKLAGLYRRLLRFIKKNGLVLAGDAYEVFVLNEIGLRDPDRFLARVEILIE